MGRIERDSLGEVEVPDGALWQAQTQRALENFAGLSGPVDPRLVRALASIKAAAARHHPDLAPETAARIAGAAEQIARGEHADQFPVDVFQTGSGTSTNMNLNEVIGTLAGAHPNDEVNAGQSSNDTFPTAIHLAAARAVVEDLQPALLHLSGTLRARAEEHRDTVKPGRTHLMDAVPITFGQELDGWASQAAYGVERLASVLPRVCELPLGGTAVGTGLNAPRGFAAAVIADLAGSTGLPLTEARDHVEAQGARDSLVELSGVLRTVAVGLYKTANDLRLLSSGPATGLAEVHLPDLQPGSSIMPGKVNPVVPEAVCQVVAQVIGNDAAIAFGGAAGALELNVMLPVIARNLLESIALLARAAVLLADRCVAGLTADVARMRALAERSAAIVTPLNRLVGYDEASRIAKRSVAEGLTVREAAAYLVDEGRVTQQQLDAALDVLAMTRRP